MKIFNIDINSSIIDEIKNFPIKYKGVFNLSLTELPPIENVNIAKNCKYIEFDDNFKTKIWNSLEQSICNKNIEYTNCIGYPPDGGMDWHTNGNNIGIRIYVSWSENGDSGMLWYKNNKVIIDKDNPGLNIRQFYTPCWHYVWSKCYRYSLGFKIKETINDKYKL